MVILNRILKFETDGRDIDIPIKIHVPVDKQDHWQCEYEIVWPNAVKK